MKSWCEVILCFLRAVLWGLLHCKLRWFSAQNLRLDFFYTSSISVETIHNRNADFEIRFTVGAFALDLNKQSMKKINWKHWWRWQSWRWWWWWYWWRWHASPPFNIVDKVSRGHKTDPSAQHNACLQAFCSICANLSHHDLFVQFMQILALCIFMMLFLFKW